MAAGSICMSVCLWIWIALNVGVVECFLYAGTLLPLACLAAAFFRRRCLEDDVPNEEQRFHPDVSVVLVIDEHWAGVESVFASPCREVHTSLMDSYYVRV